MPELPEPLRRPVPEREPGIVTGTAGPNHGARDLDAVFGALADQTRRSVLQTLMESDTRSASVPELAAGLPMSRQAFAKHLQVLDSSGLIERTESAGRKVRYRLAPEALSPAIDWMAEADAFWVGRLDRLKRAAESRPDR